MRAALLLAMFLSPTVALAGDDAWPDSPNKLWFENLQRPDNHKRPYQDKHTKSCCGSRRRGENQIPRRPR